MVVSWCEDMLVGGDEIYEMSSDRSIFRLAERIDVACNARQLLCLKNKRAW